MQSVDACDHRHRRVAVRRIDNKKDAYAVKPIHLALTGFAARTTRNAHGSATTPTATTPTASSVAIHLTRRKLVHFEAPDSSDDPGFRMRSAITALPLLFAPARAHAEPTSTLNGMWQLLGACAQSVRGPAGSAGSEVTVLFSIKRDGSLQGQPRITHSKLVGDDAAQREFLSGALSGVARYFPLAITDGLGGAVAGRPLRLRVMSRAKERGA